MVLFISSINQIPEPIPSDLRLLLNRFWPGSLTVIFKGVAYRMPKNPVILKLTEHLGPLYSTSANISGEEPISNIYDSLFVFRKHINQFMIVKSGCVPSGKPSTIYNYDKRQIVREGAIPLWKIFN